MSKPFSISKITDNLYVSGWPKEKNLKVIEKHNFDLIIHMLWQSPTKGIKGLSKSFLRLITIDFPFIALPMRIIEKAVDRATPIVDKEGVVLVYCKSGIHRSVAIAVCILISQGMSADKAMKLIKSKRKLANPDTFYIQSRIVKFEKIWQENNKS